MRYLFIVVLSFLFSDHCLAVEQTKVEFGLYMRELTIDCKNQCFTADFYWWEKFKAPSDSAYLEEIKTPEFLHSQMIESDSIQVLTFGNIVYIQGRYKGTFSFNANYRDYPMDWQSLPLKIENVSLPLANAVLIADTSSYFTDKYTQTHLALDTFIRVPDYDIMQTKYPSLIKTYYTNFGNPSVDEKKIAYSRLVYTVTIKRQSQSFILKILIPNILLLIIAYMVFFLPADRIDIAVGSTVTCMLASIALQFTINSALPDIGYLTRADKLFYLFYLLITYSFVHSVVASRLELKGKETMKRKQLGRILFPLLAIGGIIMALT
jgi:hypothetical protein